MKYTGSKARISAEVTNIFNKIIEENNIINYIEPFVGGANIIENITCKNRYGFDNNEYLISLWNALLKGYSFPEFITREEWCAVKNDIDKYPKEYVAVVGICASYNGAWFASYGGYSATKTGKDRNYYNEAVSNIKKQLPKLQDVSFSIKNYQDLSMEKMNNAFIYCDPPYQRGSRRYKESSQFNHEEYWKWIRKISINNFVVCSEYEAPDDFVCIFEKQLSKTHPLQVKEIPTEKLFVYKDGKLKTQ